MNQQILALAKEFAEKKKQYEALDADLKKIGKDWEECETKLLDALVEEGVKSIRIDGIGLVTMKVSSYLSVNAENKPRFFEYMKDKGHGSMIKEDVNSVTLTSWLKKHAVEVQKEIMESEPDLDEIEARNKAFDLLKAEGAAHFTKRGISLTKGE